MSSQASPTFVPDITDALDKLQKFAQAMREVGDPQWAKIDNNYRVVSFQMLLLNATWKDKQEGIEHHGWQ